MDDKTLFTFSIADDNLSIFTDDCNLLVAIFNPCSQAMK